MNLKFTAGQAIEVAGVTYNHLNYWARIGVVKPSVRPGAGSHTCRVYGTLDLLALKVANQLRELGCSLDAIKPIVAHMKKYGVGQEWLVVSADGLVERHGEHRLKALPQPCVIVRPSAFRDEIAAAAARVAAPAVGKARAALA